VIEKPKPSKLIQEVVLGEGIETVNNIPSDGCFPLLDHDRCLARRYVGCRWITRAAT
jgi:hypothetical protein